MSTVPLERRGTTSVPASVVARIAEQAAWEDPRVGSDAGGVLGLGARRDFATRPTAECDLYGQVAVVRLDVGLVFPVPLEPALRNLHDRVRHRVEGLTGLSLGRLDITVSWLHRAGGPRKELS